MRKTVNVDIETSNGPAVAVLKELSGPQVMRLGGPLARVIQVIRPVFAEARTEGASVVDSVLGALTHLDDKTFQTVQSGLLVGMVIRYPDGREDTKPNIDDVFDAGQSNSYLMLLFAALQLSYSQLFRGALAQFRASPSANTQP